MRDWKAVAIHLRRLYREDLAAREARRLLDRRPLEMREREWEHGISLSPFPGTCCPDCSHPRTVKCEGCGSTQSCVHNGQNFPVVSLAVLGVGT